MGKSYECLRDQLLSNIRNVQVPQVALNRHNGVFTQVSDRGADHELQSADLVDEVKPVDGAA